jgi:hypothetical protein
MADYLTAEIYVGGKIRRGLVPSLCEAICAQELGLDWIYEPFEPQTEEQLLEGLDQFWDGPALHFYDAQARFGEFFELEEFLRLHNLPYSRQSGGSYCYDAGRVGFRPGRDLVEVGNQLRRYTRNYSRSRSRARLGARQKSTTLASARQGRPEVSHQGCRTPCNSPS